MNLSEAQSLFKQMAQTPSADSDLLKYFKPAGQLNLKEAFEVYHNGYNARLTEALSETFEAVHWVLGDSMFHDLARHYIESQPSVSYNLSDYGESFPEYLRMTSFTKGIPFIYDLARFEWMFKEIFHSPTPDPLPVERIQELMHAEDFKISFIESMMLFESPYSVYEIWSRRKKPQYEFEDINWSQPENLVIYKKEQKIFVKKLSEIELHILEELQDGQPVTTALAEYANSLTQEKIAQLFQMMMKAGIIDDVTTL